MTPSPSAESQEDETAGETTGGFDPDGGPSEDFDEDEAPPGGFDEAGEPTGSEPVSDGSASAAGTVSRPRESPHRSLEERFADRTRIALPSRHNPVLSSLIDRINGDDELYALWVAQNVNAVERLGISDHGPVHVRIVANSALQLLRLLVDAGVRPHVMRDYGLSKEDAEVVVVLAALLHDVGISIHRDGHEAYSLFVAQPKVEELLGEHYEPGVATILRSEVLHAIISHRAGGEPLTLEAGILKVADALDMAEGRSRIPFETGSMSIHSVSAAAIADVHIEKGEDTAVRIRVDMTNSAGVFQVDQLLRKKLRGSGLENYLQVEAHIEAENEKRLVEHFRL